MYRGPLEFPKPGDLGHLPTYKPRSIEEAADDAVAAHEKLEPGITMKVAMGEALPAEGLYASDYFRAVRMQAEAAGDGVTLLKLLKSPVVAGTEAGPFSQAFDTGEREISAFRGGTMKVIGYWCGFLFFVSAMVWLYLNPEKARPILLDLICGSFFILTASVCLMLIYKGRVHLQVLADLKKLREPNGIKEKIWSLFFILFTILVNLIVAAVACGALKLSYISLKLGIIRILGL